MRPDPKPTKKKKRIVITDKKLIASWRKAVIERAGNKCEYPGCTVKATQLHAHHFYTRRIVPLRYDIENGVALCSYHHTLGPFAAHKDPDFKDIIIERGARSEAWHQKLIQKKQKIVKNTTAYKLECLEKLRPWL
jgi:hypothetical protein